MELGPLPSITPMAQLALKRSRCNFFQSLLLTVAVLTAPELAFAQIPGHWEEVLRVPSRIAISMAFGDAEHGLLLLDSSYYSSGSVTTSDGGKSWRRAGQGLPTFGGLLSFHSFSMPTATDAYFLAGVASYVSRDGGNTWTENKLAMLPSGSPAALRIFPNGIGRAIAYTQAYGLAVWTSSDSAKYFYPFLNEPYTEGLTIDSFRDALFLDSSEFWVSYWPGVMLHTTDGGYTWHPSSVIPAIDTFHSFQWISSTSDRRHFYILVGNNTLPYDREGRQDTFVTIPPLSADFAETTDDGITWRIDSSIGDSRIYRLVSPAPNKLWVFVGREPQFYNQVGFLRYTQNGSAYPPSFADSLFYSPDDGRTWYKDSTTFAGDTLLEMCWPDSEHGYIAAWRDSTLLVYRFIPNSSSVAGTASQAREISITPNPATNAVTIITSLSGEEVHLYDILGRDVYSELIPASGSMKLDVSQLPRGFYTVTIDVDHARLSAGRIILAPN